MAGSTNATVHGTNDGALFAGEIYGNPVTCSVGPLPVGNYQVNLYFAEIWFGAGCPGLGGVGSRIFDVLLETQRVDTGIDLFSEAGCVISTTNTNGKPVVRRYIQFVGDGTLDISLPATKNNGKISAIEIISLF
jgi:hypothetical protein